MRQDSKSLKRAIDEALTAMKTDGTLQKILQKWELWNASQSKL
jgi:ABC-type amino acid transport substrate-binding protein